MGIKIYANLDATTLGSARVQSATDLRPKGLKPLAAGDSTVVDVFLTGQSGLQDITTYPTRRLGIGSLNARPTGGTFDYGAQTGLAYNISAAALQTAIAAETAACTVTQVTSFVYKVVFDATGAQTIAAVDASALTPSSTVSIKRLVTGDGSTVEKWLIRIYQNPIALIDSSWTDISGSGIRGALNLGTTGVYELLGTATSASTFLELELTDSSGDIQTIFQIPLTIVGEVVGEGVTGVATFDSYVTSSALALQFTTGNVVWVSKSGSDSSGTVDRFDLPFLTVTAAQSAASSGDTILVLPGDYSAETALAGKDGVTYQGLDGAILPAFNVGTAIAVKGSGLCERLVCNNAGAVMDMPGMDTVASIECSSGTQTAGNAGTYISCFVGTQTAGNAGTFIDCQGGTQTIRLTDQSHDGTTRAPVYLSGSGNLNLYGDTSESTESGGTVVNIANNWSGSLYIDGLKLKATTVATDEATTGITYGTGVTGSVQLKDCTIITAEDGTGTAKAIDAPSAQTVKILGTFSATHDVDSDITLDYGDLQLTPADIGAATITTDSKVVWVSKGGNNSTGSRGRADLPFLTVTAAQAAASSGDTILVLPGDYSGETALAGKDDVTYQGLDGAILPGFDVSTAITVKGSGLCQSLTCDNAGAVMDMPGMDAVTYISCNTGTQTAGNAGTHILCEGGTQKAGNAGTYISCIGGTQTIRLTDQSHDGTTFAPVYLFGDGNLNLYGDTSESTESGGTVVNIANNWSGSLFIDGLKLKATTVGTDEATTGIIYGTGVTGKVQLKDCTIITAEDGTGTAKAIDAPSAQTVYVQGSLNTTHAVDANITLAGGATFTRTEYT